MTDLLSFHRSLADEFTAVKDRVRNLINHHPTDGVFKESILRSALRSRLPDSLMVATGFIVTPVDVSSQIDILVVDRAKPTLFRDGDTVIVTPDAVRAMIEVKTALGSVRECSEALAKMRKNIELFGTLQHGLRQKSVWSGLFAYECSLQHEVVLKAVAKAHGAGTPCRTNAICAGSNMFIRYWEDARVTGRLGEEARDCWHSYEMTSLAPAYFISNLIAHSSALDASTEPLWYPIPTGKEVVRKFSVRPGEQVKPF